MNFTPDELAFLRQLSPEKIQAILRGVFAKQARQSSENNGKPIAYSQDYTKRAVKVYGSIEAYHDYAANWLAPIQLAAYQKAQIVLQPKQLEFAHHAWAANDIRNPYKIGFGGARGPGKSFAALAEAVIECQLFDGIQVLYLRKTGKSAKQQLTKLYREILKHVDCKSTASNIRFPNGSLITIGGYKDDNEAQSYQGQEYDLIIFEESTQLSEHTVFDVVILSLRTSRPDYRPRAYFPTNPLGIGHAWYKRLFVDPHQQNKKTDTVFIPATIDDNKFVDNEYVNKLDNLTGALKKAYRYGDFDVSAGAYFDTWDFNAHTYDPKRFQVPMNWTFVAGMDAGFNHWNIVYLVARDDDGDVYVIAELAHRKLHPKEIAPDIHNMFVQFGITVNHLDYFKVGTDAFQQRAGQPETIADQYRDENIIMTAADMSPGSRVTGWQKISRLMGDPRNEKPSRLHISRDCTMLIETLPYLQRNPNNSEDVLKVDTDDEGRGGDDPGDGLRYTVFDLESVDGLFAGGMTLADESQWNYGGF